MGAPVCVYMRELLCVPTRVCARLRSSVCKLLCVCVHVCVFLNTWLFGLICVCVRVCALCAESAYCYECLLGVEGVHGSCSSRRELYMVAVSAKWEFH